MNINMFMISKWCAQPLHTGFSAVWSNYIIFLIGNLTVRRHTNPNTDLLLFVLIILLGSVILYLWNALHYR